MTFTVSRMRGVEHHPTVDEDRSLDGGRGNRSVEFNPLLPQGAFFSRTHGVEPHPTVDDGCGLDGGRGNRSVELNPLLPQGAFLVERRGWNTDLRWRLVYKPSRKIKNPQKFLSYYRRISYVNFPLG